MANLKETAQWTAVYERKPSDPLDAGPNGLDNLPNQQLVNRTAYLKTHSERIDKAATAAGSAAKVAKEKADLVGIQTNALNNAFINQGWSDRKMASLAYLFGTPAQGKYYTVDSGATPDLLAMTPEKRTAAYVDVTRYTDKYLRLDWVYSTGTHCAYQIFKINDVWFPAEKISRSDDGPWQEKIPYITGVNDIKTIEHAGYLSRLNADSRPESEKNDQTIWYVQRLSHHTLQKAFLIHSYQSGANGTRLYIGSMKDGAYPLWTRIDGSDWARVRGRPNLISNPSAGTADTLATGAAAKVAYDKGVQSGQTANTALRNAQTALDNIKIAASATARGTIQLATAAEVTTGTVGNKAVVPSTLKTELDKKLNTATHASTTARGSIQLATAAEVTAGTVGNKAVVPSALKTELDKKLNTTNHASTAARGSVQLATAAEVTAGTVGNKAIAPNTLKIELDKKTARAPIALAKEDLNTITEPHTYVQHANANADLALNYPLKAAGTLLVINSGSITTQLYQLYNSGQVYTRSCYNTTWYAWDELISRRTLAARLPRGRMAESGYFIDPVTGYTTQWGLYSGHTNSATITFPIAFKTACVNVQGTPNTIHKGIGDRNVHCVAATKTNFVIHVNSGERPTAWFAIGY